MKPRIRNWASGFVVLAILLTPVLVFAQGLGQTFEWPEIGFTMDYPAGWTVADLDSEARILLSDPNYDPNSDEPPDSPSVVVMGLPSEATAVMGTPEEILNLFASDVGASVSDLQEINVSGYDALRLQGDVVGEGFRADLVLVSADSYTYILMGVTPLGGDISDLLTGMLETVIISEPAAGPITAPVVPDDGILVNGVRVTVDQSITGNWNEIDAVELVGYDADGVEVRQWASDAAATSEYTADSWSAQQATGEPNTEGCGDYSTSWASADSDGYDSLTLFYDVPVAASAVTIYETYNPGAIVLVELLPTDGSEPITVFSGVDPTTSCPGQFVIAIGSAAPAGALSYGDSISGSVSGSAYAENWSFAGSAGDVVTITMVADSGDLDPYLYLLNARGAELTSNDDAADASIGTFNAQIASFTLPESGQYTIKATRFGDEFGSSSGTYTLTLAAAGTSSAPLKGQPGGGTMTYGDTVTGTITQAAFQQDWTFTGAQGDAVTITMVAGTGSDLDSYISLLGPNGMELTSNDDASDMSVGALNSQIAAFVLPADGTYTIRATRFGSDMGASTGAYELSLELTETTDGASISYGDTVTGEITNSVYEQAWVFDGTAGDVITITMVDASGSATLDSYLTLQDPSGRELLSNDDAIDTSVGALNAQIAKFQLPSTGSFTIIATRFGGEFGSATGAYELTLTKVK